MVTQKNPTIHILEGDITRHPCDAIMTAINSEGMWFGGVDGAIMRVAGDYYHKQAATLMPLKDLQTIVARGSKSAHNANFNDVVFVVDDLQSSVDKIIYEGLFATIKEDYQTIAIPSIRMGVMAGVVEKTPEKTINGIKLGLDKFLKEYGDRTSLDEITFIVYNNPTVYEIYKNQFRL